MQGKPMQLLRGESGDAAELYVYGDIYEGAHVYNSFGSFEDGTDSVEVAQAIADLPDEVSTVVVRINSCGGDVMEGLAIHNALKQSGRRVVTRVDGFACSIASVVFMAGDERVMAPASLLMVHDAWMPACGNAAELRKAADDLDVITSASKRAYLEASGMDAAELDALMGAETWIEPDRALELGLATAVDGPGEGGPQQSAMPSIVRRLTAEPVAVTERAAPISAPQLDELADKVARRLGQPKQQAGPEEAPAPLTGFARLAALLSD